jgi:hypothetical protein
MSEKRTYDAVRKTDRKNDFEEVLRNVNVASRTEHSEDEAIRIGALTAQLVEELGDPKSRNFYRLVAEKMPESLVFMTLSETKDARRTGQLRKSPGAYFTYAIKQRAQELGVTLSARTSPQATAGPQARPKVRL